MSVQSPAILPTQLILHSLFSVFLTKRGLLIIALVQFDLGPKIALCTRRVTRTNLHFGKSATSVVSSAGLPTLLANVSARPTNACAVAHQSVTNCTDWFGEGGCNPVKQWGLFE